MTGRWGDPGSDPLADIARMREQVFAVSSYRPTRLILSRKVVRTIVRRSMTKRRWRRIRNLY